MALVDGAASDDANWSGGAKPVAGDNAIFDATSVKNCTWDLALALGEFSENAGYTGKVTQAASFSCTKFTLALGASFEPSNAHTVTVSGPVSALGTYTANVWNLILTGEGATAVLQSSYATRIRNLTVSANVTCQDIYMTNALTVDAGKTLTIPAAGTGVFIMVINNGLGANLANNGQIAGPGTFRIYAQQDATVTFGTVNAPMYLQTTTDDTVNKVVTMAADTTFGSTFTIAAQCATKTNTLDLDGNRLTVVGALTPSTRGIITNGTICYGSLGARGVGGQLTNVVICPITDEVNLTCEEMPA